MVLSNVAVILLCAFLYEFILIVPFLYELSRSLMLSFNVLILVCNPEIVLPAEEKAFLNFPSKFP